MYMYDVYVNQRDLFCVHRYEPCSMFRLQTKAIFSQNSCRDRKGMVKCDVTMPYYVNDTLYPKIDGT